MDPTGYKKAIESAYAESEALIRQRTAIDARLSQLMQTIEALAGLLGNTPEVDPGWLRAVLGAVGGMMGAEVGITDAIRQILTDRKVPLSPIQIRDALNKQGFDINSYASGLTVIHNTLKRLERQGEVTIVRNPSGGLAYVLPPRDLSAAEMGMMGVPETIKNFADLASEEELEGPKLWEGYPDPLNKRGKKK